MAKKKVRRVKEVVRIARSFADPGQLWVCGVVPLAQARQLARAYLRLRKRHGDH